MILLLSALPKNSLWFSIHYSYCVLTNLRGLNPSDLSIEFPLSTILLVYIDCELSHQGHPDDILPIVLTSATQELFGCIADEDVTGESPYKLLEKDDIIQDIKTRAAVSDFSPMKQIVLVRLIHCHTDHLDNTPKTLWWYTDPTLRAVGTGQKPVQPHCTSVSDRDVNHRSFLFIYFFFFIIT